MFCERISLKSVLLLLLMNFVSGLKVGICVHSTHRKYQVKPHLSPSCAASIAHRNHFCVSTNRINLLNLK